MKNLGRNPLQTLALSQGWPTERSVPKMLCGLILRALLLHYIWHLSTTTSKNLPTKFHYRQSNPHFHKNQHHRTSLFLNPIWSHYWDISLHSTNSCVSMLQKKILNSFLNKFIYLFLATLGLCCWARTFSSCGERGLLCVAVRGLLTAVASPVVEHGL